MGAPCGTMGLPGMTHLALLGPLVPFRVSVKITENPYLVFTFGSRAPSSLILHHALQVFQAPAPKLWSLFLRVWAQSQNCAPYFADGNSLILRRGAEGALAERQRTALPRPKSGTRRRPDRPPREVPRADVVKSKTQQKHTKNATEKH